MSLDSLQIRPGDAADLDALLAVAGTSEGAPLWSETVWRGLLQPAAGSDPVRQVFVALDAERMAGFLVVMLCSDVAEMESVAVRAELRRRGIGDALCRYAMRWAADRGAARMELEVRSQAIGARALYASLGFAEQGVRRGYYQKPEDDALLLSAALGAIEPQGR
jgi:ribosomal protein S18 acetylase RimI-like enzyme